MLADQKFTPEERSRLKESWENYVRKLLARLSNDSFTGSVDDDSEAEENREQEQD